MAKGVPPYKILLAILAMVLLLALAAPFTSYLPTAGQGNGTLPASVPATIEFQAKATAAVSTPVPVKPIPYVQILMYHEIGDGPNSLFVSEKNFQEQMKYLYDNGYCGITLAEGKALLDGRGALPAGKPVVLTFDDSYSSFFSAAYPVLKQYGFRATVFVITDRSGNPHYPNHLSWEQITTLASDGMEIGSHTRSHPSLPILDPARLHEEISGSKRVLEEHLGQPVASFCYPAGEYNQAVLDAVAHAGYQQAVTVKYGWATKNNAALEIPRIRISRYLTHEQFAEMFTPPQAKTTSKATPGMTTRP